MSESTKEPAAGEPIEAPSASTTIDQQSADSGLVRLPGGAALTSIDAGAITARYRSGAVVVAGPHGSGKTTILTTLYDQFQMGPFGHWAFAGSETLLAFEERCHDSRLASGRSTAETVRTSGGSHETWLHLGLRSKESTEHRIDLLLSDLSGEVFERILSQPERITELTYLRRADHVAVVVDGDLIANSETSHGVRHTTYLLLRTLLESKTLGPTTRLEVVLSKLDRLLAQGWTEAQFANEVIPEWTDMARSHSVDLSLHLTAARPLGDEVPWGRGMAELLETWAGLSDPVIAPRTVAPVPAHARAIDRFEWPLRDARQ